MSEVTKENVFLGAKVTRGKGWNYGNSDDGVSYGIVTSIIESKNPFDVSVSVEWTKRNKQVISLLSKESKLQFASEN